MNWNSFSLDLTPFSTEILLLICCLEEKRVGSVSWSGLCLCVPLVVQAFSRVQLLGTPWTAARQASFFFTISQSLLKLMSVESVISSKHLILRCPLLLPSIFPSMSLFKWVSSSHQVAKVLELQHQSFQWIFRFPLGSTGWISLQSKGTFKNLL